MNPVLDASVLIASIRPLEPQHRIASGLYWSHPAARPYLVPAIFRVEVVAALSRRGEPSMLLDAVDATLRGPRFQSMPVDEPLLDVAATIARRAGLRAYDAIYAAVASVAGAPLYSLDAELCDRLGRAFPEIRVVSSTP